MKANITALLSCSAAAYGFECTPAAFQKILPANATAVSAVTVAANGSYIQSPGNVAYPINPTNLPGLCALTVNVTSSPTSSFLFGLFLPDQWNSRFLAVGNGGFAGGINWLDMGSGVQYGFAVMSTNTGHNSTSGDITWALNQPQKKIDFGYRAMHGSITQAKQIVEAYYSCKIAYNYYSGCSTGGRQGLKEIEFYPDSFDGVLAGAPAWWTARLQTWTLKVGLFNLPVHGSNRIDPSMFPVVGAEALRQCDVQDGVKDNIISDPLGCDFNPELLLCNNPSANKSACLTSAQIETLYNIYGDYKETNNTFIFPGLQVGSEAQWPFLLSGSAPSSYGTQYVQDLLINYPNWTPDQFNFSIIQLADRIDPGNASANDFDLSPFQKKGGKLLMYHGFSDALIPTGSSIYFYKHVLRTLLPRGIPLDPWFRFFLIPGMQHCAGTPTNVNAPWYIAGGNQAAALGTGVKSVPGFADAKHDALLALMDWVEKGKAVDSIIATKYKNDTTHDSVLRQRPICMWPKQAIYNGKGNTDLPESWTCKTLF